MNKKLIIALVVAGSIGLGFALAQTLVSLDKATLAARVAFLEKYVRGDELSEEEAKAYISRLQAIKGGGGAAQETKEALVSLLTELEASVGFPVRSAKEAQEGETCAVWGRVTSVYRGTDKNGFPYISIELDGTFSVVQFRTDTSGDLYNVAAGDGILAVGKVGSYQGKPQIIVSPGSAFIGKQ